MDEVEIRLLNDADGEAVLKLYQEAGWWEEGEAEDPATAAAIVRGSFCFAGAFADGQFVGMARALSDGVSDAYIQDVVVDPRFRKRGIGVKLVQTMSGELHRRGIRWVGLIAEPGTSAFYEKLGFVPLAGYVPMRLKKP